MGRLFADANPEKIRRTLEHRLDQVVFALGLSRSSRIARQLISHGHILVNGRKVTVSSFSVKVGDVISIRPESRGSKLFEDIATRLKAYEPPAWLSLDKANFTGTCKAPSTSVDSTFPFDITVVGQFFAR
jgi:small subunit ribosomal protein S4